MLLAIDIGNTNIVFAVYDGKQSKGMWRCKTDAARTSDEYSAFLSQHFELSSFRLSDIHDVIVSSVVPDTDFAITQFCQTFFKSRPIFVGRDTGDLGIKILIDRPSELGADRLVNSFAVHKEYGCAAIVVDFGTATTFDIVDQDGNFCGGVIAPGPNLSLEALHLAAAKLPSVPIKRPKSAIAKNTVDAMQSGIFWGYVGLVETILSRLIVEIDGQPKIIATGGLARLFKDDIPRLEIIDDELTLKGLLYIYEHIKKT
jgi:type III pantothenate kinase